MPPAVVVTPELITITVVGDVTTPAANDICAVLTFNATVSDIAANARPHTLTNRAAVTFSVGAQTRTSSASVDTQLVEPNIKIEKRGPSTTVSPGAPVVYTLVVTNQSDAAVSTAHDLKVVDDFSGSSVAAVTANPDGGVVAGSTITWTLPADPDKDGTPGLAPGASFELTYTVALTSNLVAGGTLHNVATVTASSLPAPTVGRRTSASACSPGGCPATSTRRTSPSR